MRDEIYRFRGQGVFAERSDCSNRLRCGEGEEAERDTRSSHAQYAYIIIICMFYRINNIIACTRTNSSRIHRMDI